jgi:Flp pilus assembly protein TadD
MEAWDEALAVCATEVAGTVPRSLRRLAARTTTERGDRDGGLAILDRLLDEMPEDIAARELRSEWRSAAGRHDEAVADATDLTVREPQRAVAWGYLGDALAMAGRNRAAAAAFRRGSDLDPGYDFGHAGWFDQALADGDLAGAAAALERLRRGEPAASTRRRAVRLAVAQGRPGDAADDLAALAADADAEEELVAACPERLPAEWLVVLHRAWETGGNRGVGTVLARDRVRGWSRRELAGWLMAGPRRTPAWNAAVGQLIDDTVNGVGPDPVPLLRRMMGGDLAADDRAWASVGWYLHERDRHREAVAWMADWQARPGCPAWALPYLIAPLIRIGRWRDGLAVAAAAPVEGGHADAIRTWRAWAAALDGDRERARELLPKVGALEPYQGMAEVHALVAALLDPDPEAPWRLAAARRGALTGARWEPFRPYVRATLGVLAERDGRWWRRWQARWLGW